MHSTSAYWVIAAMLTAVLLTLGQARPQQSRSRRTVELAQVLNRTVCPIEVVVDEDPARLPRRIKMMRCAQNSLHWCKVQGIPDHECCAHHHAGHYMDCVEMRDTVVVFYEGSTEPRTYEVSVGCTCMIGESTDAPEVPPGPT